MSFSHWKYVLFTLLIQTMHLKDGKAQIFFDFNKPDQLHSWIGDTVHYAVTDGQLNLQADPDQSPAFIYTESIIIDSAVWELDFVMDFNPSSNNHLIVYLAMDNPNPGIFNGYYVKLGGSEDEISLYQVKDGYSTLIIDGIDDRLNKSNVAGKIRVSHTEKGDWMLEDKLENESEYYLEGTVKLDNNFFSSYAGLECNYTSTRKDRFHFDNFRITGNPYTDRDPPEILSIEVPTKNRIRIKYNETIVPPDKNSFVLFPHGLSPEEVKYDSTFLKLKFPNIESNAEFLQLKQAGIKDISNNKSDSSMHSFFYFYEEEIQKGDVLITEILADPSPSINLPETEFVEIYNHSNKIFDINRWSFSDTAKPSLLDSLLLYPEMSLILCPKGDVYLFEDSLNIMGLSPWPSLNNGSDSLLLWSADSVLIDMVPYEKDFFETEDKAIGGWSLELQNPKLGCFSYTNWKESANENGGTPGEYKAKINHENFRLEIDTIVANSVKLRILFNSKIDCGKTQVKIIGPDSLEIKSTFNCWDPLLVIEVKSLLKTGDYEILMDSLHDCRSRNYSFRESFWIENDLDPPVLTSISNTYHNQIDMRFNEPISEFIEVTVNNLVPEINYYENETDSISLKIEQWQSEIWNISFKAADLKANQLDTTFNYIPNLIPQAEFGDLVITEVLTEPGENLQIPKGEFIEIYNHTNQDLPLRDYQLSDLSKSVQISNGIAKANTYTILTSGKYYADFSRYGPTVKIDQWPAINNNYEYLTIKNRSSALVSLFEYSMDDYQSDAEISASLEVIDPEIFCGNSSNIRLSQSPSGGTPGKINSVSGNHTDNTAPFVMNSELNGSKMIELHLSEKIHPQTDINLAFNPHHEIDSIENKKLDVINIYFLDSLEKNRIYNLVIDDLEDCQGNHSKDLDVNIIVPDVPANGDLIINEVMFEPSSDISEYIELYNNSNKYLDLEDFQLLVNGQEEALSKKVIYPNDYIVLTDDPNAILVKYQQTPIHTLSAQPLPSLNNKESVLVLKSDTVKIDSSRYSSDWHFRLLDNVRSVSLEKINPFLDGTDSTSWHSAAKSSNYATPGYLNSQNISENNSDLSFWTTPPVFSPNNDGRDDFLYIHVNMAEPGFIGNLYIFDLNGRMVRQLLNNHLLQSKEVLSWDGTDSEGSALSTGYYILVADLTNDLGKVYRFRSKIGLFQNEF